MGLDTSNLGRSFTEKMSREDRAALGIMLPGDSVPQSAEADACEDEGELQSAIIKHCAANGYMAFYSAMHLATTRRLGEPDFEILLPGRKLLLIECKRRNGKRSPEQIGVAMQAEKLGHTVYLVKSEREYLEALNIELNRK